MGKHNDEFIIIDIDEVFSHGELVEALGTDV